jgi:hypothetical protein
VRTLCFSFLFCFVFAAAAAVVVAARYVSVHTWKNKTVSELINQLDGWMRREKQQQQQQQLEKQQ